MHTQRPQGGSQRQVFLEEMAGSKRDERLSSSPLYANTYKELLSTAFQSRATRQAPRMYTFILASLEQIVCDRKNIPYYRVYSWWVFVLNWSTLRFGCHRGLKLQDESVKGNSLSANLTRAKKTGEDRELTFRPAYIDSCCFVTKAEWM